MTFPMNTYLKRNHFSDFFRTALFSEKLLLHQIPGFPKSHFLAGVIFTEYLIFLSETFTEQPLMGNRKFFRAVTLRNSHFFGGGIA